MRCEITTTNSCVTDESTWQQQTCDVITPIACNDSTGPRCGVVDKTYTCWPRPDWPNTFQFLRNRTYFATAVSSTGMESPPSMLNQAWLNYCGIAGGSDCPATPSGCAQRRDPDGDGDYLVCGDESAMLMSPGAPGPLAPDSASPADTAVCETLDGVDPDDPYAGIMAPQRIIGQVDPNPPSRYIYYHLDHLGSPRLATDAAGVKIAEHHYLPFGDERPSQADPSKNTRAFTGHERDDETGLDYMLARYYGSSLARFLSPDKGKNIRLESPQTWDEYTYVDNNPLIYTDPTGEYVCNGSKSQCQSVKKGLKDAKKAARHLKGGERKALKRAIKAYGKEGKDNGVTVQFGNVKGGEASTGTKDGRTTVTFDLESMAKDFGSSYSTELAASTAHEGVHIEQQQDHGMPTSREEELAGETFAYAVQASVNKGLSTNSVYGVWSQRGGMNPTIVNDLAETSTELWCVGNSACK